MEKLTILLERDHVFLYPFYFINQSLTKELSETFDCPVSRTLEEYTNSNINYFVPAGEIETLSDKLIKKILVKPNFIDEIEKNVESLGKDLLGFLGNIDVSKIDEYSSRELNDFYQTYKLKLRALRVWGWVPVLIDGGSKILMSDYLMKELGKMLVGDEKQNASNYFSILSTSNRLSEVSKEQLERLRLILQLQKENPLIFDNEKMLEKKPLVLQHTYDFCWLPYGYAGPEMTVDDVVNAILDDIKNNTNIKKEVEKLENHSQNVENKKRAIIGKLNLPDKLATQFKTLSRLMFSKDNRKGIFQKSYVLMDPVLAEIAKRLDLSVIKIKYLTDQEIESALIKNDTPKDLSERLEYCVALTKSGETTILTGQEAKKIVAESVGVIQRSQDYPAELKGMVAFAGTAKGSVKIVKVKDDMTKFQQGDILVSQATNPDLISAMKKAGAIITETGGITSHAAIVSRELQIPCIVGVREATNNLKDGDLVEVDAQKGNVKVLERA